MIHQPKDYSDHGTCSPFWSERFCGCRCACGALLPIHNLKPPDELLEPNPKLGCKMNQMLWRFLRLGGKWEIGRFFVQSKGALYPAVATLVAMEMVESAAQALFNLTQVPHEAE